MAIRSRNYTGAKGFTVGGWVSKDLGWYGSSYAWSDWGGDVFDSFGYYRIVNVATGQEVAIPLPNGNTSDNSLLTQEFSAFGHTWEVVYGFAAQGLYRIDVRQKTGTPITFRFRFSGNFGADGHDVYLDKYQKFPDSDITLHYIHHYGGGDPSVFFYMMPYDNELATQVPYTYSRSGDNMWFESVNLTDGFNFYQSKYNDVYQWVMNDLNISKAGVSDLVVTSPIHKQNCLVSFNVTHQTLGMAKFRVLVGGVQVFPATAGQYYGFVATPYSFNIALHHSVFTNIGDNQLIVEAVDEELNSSYKYANVEKTSVAPNISVTMTSTIVHNQNITLTATITDSESDRVSYQYYINGVLKEPDSGWTQLANSPVQFKQIISNSFLKVGVNEIKIVAKDEFGVSKEWKQNVIKTNTQPNIGDINFDGLTFFANISDAEFDTVRYRILLNDDQVFPDLLTGRYTGFLQTPFNVKFVMTSKMVKLGVINKLVIELEDALGGTRSYEHRFLGEYAGLMFHDGTGSWYSTDFGQVIRYLDLGTIVAGMSSLPKKVYIRNTLGYPVKNLKVWHDNRQLDGISAWVEISETNSPFADTPMIVYPITLNDGEDISFYVRIASTRLAGVGGMFDLLVSAELDY